MSSSENSLVHHVLFLLLAHPLSQSRSGGQLQIRSEISQPVHVWSTFCCILLLTLDTTRVVTNSVTLIAYFLLHIAGLPSTGVLFLLICIKLVREVMWRLLRGLAVCWATPEFGFYQGYLHSRSTWTGSEHDDQVPPAIDHGILVTHFTTGKRGRTEVHAINTFDKRWL